MHLPILFFLILLSSSTTTTLVVVLSETTNNTTTTTTAAAKSVFILAGQSNMVGIGGVMNGIWDGVVPPECQPNPLILRLNEALGLKWEEAREPLHRLLPNDNDTFTGIGPGMPFANALLKRDPAIGTIGLVPCARSGSSISSWARDTPNYSKMLRLARAAVNQGGILRAFLWYQGESDTNELADAEAYSRRLVELFNNVRADLQSPSLQMIQVALASGSKYKERIREIQLNTELPNVKCVDAGGLPLIKYDKLHLSTVSQVKLGTMLADAFLHD
ncbi:carbohydrate esterase [Perilla frutescens var. hirtella]|nr:carbohydrate esterase [Perilla frutescens var. hirtella]